MPTAQTDASATATWATPSAELIGVAALLALALLGTRPISPLSGRP